MTLRPGGLLLSLLISSAILLLPAAAHGQDRPPEVPVTELLSDGAAFDGRSVIVVGELVGDYGFRDGNTVWTQLNGDSYAFSPVVEGGPLTGPNTGIAVMIDSAKADQLTPPGRYRSRGPLVEAEGVWRFHDPGRAGESYLAVVDLRVVESGRALEEQPNLWVYLAGSALLVTAAGWWVTRRRST